MQQGDNSLVHHSRAQVIVHCMVMFHVSVGNSTITNLHESWFVCAPQIQSFHASIYNDTSLNAYR